MRIKKFNELFDSEEVKSEHEIEYLTGRLKDILKGYAFAKRIGPGSKDETIENFVGKISAANYPFFKKVFVEKKKFTNITTDVYYDKEEEYYNFITKDNEVGVSFGIRIKSLNDYDAYVIVYGSDGDDEGESYAYKNIDYNEVVDLIKEIYIPIMVSLGFGEVVSYGEEDITPLKN